MLPSPIKIAQATIKSKIPMKSALFHQESFLKADDHLLRFAKRSGDDHFLRFAKSYLIRGARDQTNEHMLRFAKRSVEEPDQPSDSNDDHLLRFAKKSGDDHFLRFA